MRSETATVSTQRAGRQDQAAARHNGQTGTATKGDITDYEAEGGDERGGVAVGGVACHVLNRSVGPVRPARKETPSSQIRPAASRLQSRRTVPGRAD